MTESSHGKNIKVSHILIALLAVIVLLQGFFLIHQARRQAALEKKHKEIVSAVEAPSTISGSRQQPSFPAVSRGWPQTFFNQDPWQEFDEMTRRMSGLMRHAFTFGSPLFQNMSQGTGFDFTPAVDLQETETAYIVRSDLPGLEKDKINLAVRDNILTIEGLRETSKETQDTGSGFYAQERSYGSFARSLGLPGPVDESKITAEYKNGVLTITLPKAAGQKSVQKVSIQ
jgi:HSP20 family protein